MYLAPCVFFAIKTCIVYGCKLVGCCWYLVGYYVPRVLPLSLCTTAAADDDEIQMILLTTVTTTTSKEILFMYILRCKRILSHYLGLGILVFCVSPSCLGSIDWSVDRYNNHFLGNEYCTIHLIDLFLWFCGPFFGLFLKNSHIMMLCIFKTRPLFPTNTPAHKLDSSSVLSCECNACNWLL